MEVIPAPLWAKVFVVLTQVCFPIAMARVGKLSWVSQKVWIVSLVLYALLDTGASIAFCTDHYFKSILLAMTANALFLALNSRDLNDGNWKKRWGKIKSAALTAVNQASFRNQQKEAFS